MAVSDNLGIGLTRQVQPSYVFLRNDQYVRWRLRIDVFENKDSLVVDAIGYNERFWLTNGGLPHTDGLRLMERFTRTDFNTLKYDVTVYDDRTYTRPWTAGFTMSWVADQEIQEYFCEENAESTFVR